MIDNKLDGSGERLKKFRKKIGLTQIDFAKIINTSNGHVSDMEKDRKNITDTTIELLKLKCQLNESWLRTGEGGDENMFKKEFLTDEYTVYAAEIGNGASDIIKAAIVKYGRLSPENKRIVNEALNIMLQSFKEG